MNALPPALWTHPWRGMDLRVFATGDDSPLALAEAAAVLTEEERTRAARFLFPADRERWTRCRALLRIALAERLHTAPGAVRFSTGLNNKPELTAGQADTALHFNLSHSGPLMALALGSESVGIDIECRKENLRVREVSAHAFRPEEHQAIVAHPDPQAHFLILWTAKEAVMKCTGQGLSLSPAAVIVHSESRATIEGMAGNFVLHSYSHPGTWVLTAAQRA